MNDRDIRKFFSSEGSKSSTNKSNLVKQITLNINNNFNLIKNKSFY